MVQQFATVGALTQASMAYTVEMMTFLLLRAETISLCAKDPGMTMRNGIYLNLRSNSSQTVPLFLEIGLA